MAKQLGDYGLKITSVASETGENIFAACAKAGVPLIKIMLTADLERGYLASEVDMRK